MPRRELKRALSALQRRGELRIVSIEAQRDAAIRISCQEMGTQVVGTVELKFVAHMQTSRIACQRMPRTVGARLIERDADTRVASPCGELRWNHARVVGHYDIAWPQQRGQIAHQPIDQCCG